jgi:hypothetical protein
MHCLWSSLGAVKEMGMTSESGSFVCGGKMVISDPCYDRDSGKSGRVLDVEPGRYTASVVVKDFAGWGTRVESLTALRDDCRPGDVVYVDPVGTVDVDSGQMSMVDFDKYPEVSPDYDDADDFYRRLCQLSLSEEHWGTFDGGVVSHSGFGDGQYRCEVLKRGDKNIGARVVFIAPDNNEADE